MTSHAIGGPYFARQHARAEAFRRQSCRILAWSAALGGLACAVLAGLGGLGAPFELFTHFRPHYAVVSVLALALAWRLHITGASVVAGCAAALHLAAMAAALPPPAAPLSAAAPGAAQTTIVWANVRGKRDAVAAAAALAERTGADVLALTELPHDWEAILAQAAPDFVCRSATDRLNPFTVALATRAPCAPHFSPKSGGWRTAARAVAAPDDLYVAAIHPPRPTTLRLPSRDPYPSAPIREDRIKARDAVIELSAQRGAEHANAVVIGDYNATLWSPVIARLTRQGLTRAPCGSPFASTWITRWPLAGLGIDHAFISTDLAARCTVAPSIGSDHFPLVLTVAARAQPSLSAELTPDTSQSITR